MGAVRRLKAGTSSALWNLGFLHLEMSVLVDSGVLNLKFWIQYVKDNYRFRSAT